MDGLIVDWGTCAHQPAYRHVLAVNTQRASRSHSKGTCCAVTPEPEWVDHLRDHSMLVSSPDCIGFGLLTARKGDFIEKLRYK